MSKIETQLEINGVTYSGKDLNLILLGMSIREERIIKLLEQRATLMNKCKYTECICRQSAIDFEYAIELIKGETKAFLTSSQVGQMVDEMLEE